MPQELSKQLLGSQPPDAGSLLQIAHWFRLEMRTAAPEQVRALRAHAADCACTSLHQGRSQDSFVWITKE